MAGWAALLFAADSNATAQGVQKPCGTVTVAAAADLIYAMNEIAANFRKTTGCEVRVSAGSSGNFLTQIENGAPFDLFFSADIEYPKKLEAEGLAATGSTYPYAVGRIVLWVRNDSKLDIGKGLEVLRPASIQKLAIANPQHAPYGRAAEEALRKAGVYDAIRNRLVLGENVAQAAEFVQSGNADAGILALSVAISRGFRNQGHYWIIPETLHSPIRQGAVILRASKNPEGARALLAYLKTPAATALLAQYGFTPPDAGKP